MQNKSKTTSAKVPFSQKSSWISSAFEGFDSTAASGKPTAKHARLTPLKNYLTHPRNHLGELWVDQHAPTILTDLAVHKKKISEVEAWLEKALNCKHSCQILLLTGPAGSGKTACLRALATPLHFDIQEWINTTTSVYIPRDETQWVPDGAGFSESQLTKFRDFLMRANRYLSLQIGTSQSEGRKVILIEEFPNVFFRDSAALHQILRSYLQRGRCPLVIIISDCASGESSERILLPATLQRDLNITNISFNAVAQTSLVKVLSKIASLEAKKASKQTFYMPTKEELEDLATSSSGDIRTAINSLQFRCHTGGQTSAVNCPKRVVARQSQQITKSQQMSRRCKSAAHREVMEQGRDSSLFLFRALGKVLYCKRQEASADSVEHNLPEHLLHCYRDPLLENPESVLEKSHMTGDMFVAFLHQNFVDLFNSIEDLAEACDYMSQSDHIATNWENRGPLAAYSSCVAIRGIMYCNSCNARAVKTTNQGWRPLNKPQSISVNKMVRDNTETARSLFQGYSRSASDLHTELIPYLSMIDVRMHDPAQINYLQAVGRMQQYGTRVKAERLCENDVTFTEDLPIPQVSRSDTAGQEADPDLMPLSQGQPQIPASDGGEDCMIEEFDD